ncbi:MAG: PaaI family thioesterase [Chloroflexi bacterium]|nr:PaaI family thioesterase [Chloroflexota bacterium]MBP7043952.1 PaaI family thioesterase [Chloroflexota bacterium]
MHSPNPDYQTVVAKIFQQAAFVRELGLELVGCGPGWCESRLVVQPRHMQQDDVVHAGVQTTIADHTAGAAAGTIIPPDAYVLSVEFKMNLLRPGVGEILFCRADVLKPGRQFSVVESEVFAIAGNSRKLISKFIGTMVTMPRTSSSKNDLMTG